MKRVPKLKKAVSRSVPKAGGSGTEKVLGRPGGNGPAAHRGIDQCQCVIAGQ